MSQKKNTPKHLVELIERHANYVDHVEERIRVKATVPVENQADHIRNGNPDLWIGRAEGFWVALEAALMAYGCYAGYMNVGFKKRHADGSTSRESVGPDHPEYRDWARVYFTCNVTKRITSND